jgi:hypothetical protein
VFLFNRRQPNDWRTLGALTCIYVLIFLPLQLAFPVPFQGDDILYSVQINQDRIDVQDFYEYRRANGPGWLMYILYQWSDPLKDSHSTTGVFFFIGVIHYILVMVTAQIIQTIRRMRAIAPQINIAFWGGLLVMFQQPAIECLSNISYGFRLIGAVWVGLFLWLQLRQLALFPLQIPFGRGHVAVVIQCITSAAVGTLAVAFYEVNAYFLMLAGLLPVLIDIPRPFRAFAYKWRAYFFQWGLAAGIPIAIQLQNMNAALTERATNAPLAMATVMKQWVYATAQHLLPNFHGALFYTSIPYALAMGVLLYLLVQWGRQAPPHAKWMVGAGLGHAVTFIFLVGWLPYYAPRLFVANAMVTSIMMAFAVNALHGRAKWALVTIVASSVLNVGHFYALQQADHRTLMAIRHLLESPMPCRRITATAHRMPVLDLSLKQTQSFTEYFNYSMDTPNSCHTVHLHNPFFDINVTSGMYRSITAKLWSGFRLGQRYTITHSPY